MEGEEEEGEEEEGEEEEWEEEAIFQPLPPITASAPLEPIEVMVLYAHLLKMV